jgi:glycine cleavage system H protein
VEGKIAVVGITDYAQGELGDIVFVEIETEGETLDLGETYGTIEAVKTVSDMYMPVGGKIVEINPKIETDPAVVNKDPYGDGWMIKIEMTDAAEVNNLLDADKYTKLIG